MSCSKLKQFFLLIFLAFFFPIKVHAQTPNVYANATSTESGVNTKVVTDNSLALITERFSAAIERVENILKRISSRLNKLQKTNSKAKRLNTNYVSLNRQLEKLKIEFKKTEDLSLKLMESGDPQKDYQFFRKQAILTQTLLKDVLTNEKKLVMSIKEIASPSAKLTVTVSPKAQ